MKEINEEIKQTLNLMQTDIDYEAHSELQCHLACLLEIKRNELQQRLVERSWLDHADGMGSVVKFDQAPYKSVKLEGQVADEAKPLTVDELMAGGWWCADVSAECEMAFKSCGLDVVRDGWGGIGGHIGDCCILGHPKHVSRAWIKSIVSGEKQIHRIGNEFYWGEA